MNLTGHKMSLTPYQQTKDKQKIQMGNVIHQSMTTPEASMEVPARQQILPKNVAIPALQ